MCQSVCEENTVANQKLKYHMKQIRTRLDIDKCKVNTYLFGENRSGI